MPCYKKYGHRFAPEPVEDGGRDFKHWKTLPNSDLQLLVSGRSYNRFGGDANLDCAARFLLEGAPSFGSGLKHIELALWFSSSKPNNKGMEASRLDFERKLGGLPKLRYEKKKARLTIEVRSVACGAEEYVLVRGASYQFFSLVFGEVKSALMLISKKKIPSFDTDQFLDWIRKREEEGPPSSQGELEALRGVLREREAARRAAMDPMEALGIEWAEYHPKARQVLPDPFFWDQSNYFAPHGNDTGADLIADFRKWRKKNRRTEPESFLQAILSAWDLSSWQADQAAETKFQAEVALAFACLKIDGECLPGVAGKARQALVERIDWAKGQDTWEHRDEALDRYGVLRDALAAEK